MVPLRPVYPSGLDPLQGCLQRRRSTDLHRDRLVVVVVRWKSKGQDKGEQQ